jgi:hypothetical protein
MAALQSDDQRPRGLQPATRVSLPLVVFDVAFLSWATAVATIVSRFALRSAFSFAFASLSVTPRFPRTDHR